MEKLDQVKNDVRQKIARKTLETSQARIAFCQKLSSKDYDEQAICKDMDQLLLQYEALGHLNGELAAFNIFEGILRQTT